MPKKITGLVFQGGSVKGTAYLGALRAQLDYLDMRDIKRVGGTSAGSITAVLLAMGCNTERIDELLPTFNFRSVLDDKKGGIPTQTKVLKTIGKIDDGKPFFFSKIPAKPVKIPLGIRLLQDKGIYEGEYIRNWMEDMIQEQVKMLTNGEYDGTNLTFGELHVLAENYPGVFRDLFVVGANLTTGEKKVFSYKNPETKDVIISDAIRISMSIPYLFKPHHIYYKINGKRILETSRDLWTDGGVYDNYPIDLFDDEAFISEGDEPLQRAEDGRYYNPQTLGFRLVSGEKKGYFEGVTTKKSEEKITGNIKDFTLAIAKTNFALQESYYSRPENVERTVYIDHLDISTVAFNLSEKQLEALMDSGFEATHNYLAERFPKLDQEAEAEAETGFMSWFKF